MTWLRLEGATALLLAASLAPTDPVLASDGQVGAPSEEHEEVARFALTSEAGLNDGLAFPSVALAMTAVAGGGLAHVPLVHWFAVYVVWKIGSGVLVGALRSSHRNSDYHQRMHDFAEELERLSMMVLLVCFGAALGRGHVFGALLGRLSGLRRRRCCLCAR